MIFPKKNIDTILLLTILLFTSASARALEIDAKEEGGKPAQDVVVAFYPQEPLPVPVVKKQSIVQKDFLFHPFVTVVTVGSSVNFPNLDKTKHHVYSFSKAAQFDIPLYNGMSSDITFKKKGIVTIGCNIHDWMLAYVAVLDTPYFTKTNADGKGDIASLPAGHYRVKYWYPGLQGDDMTGLENDFAAPGGGHYSVTIHGTVQAPPVKPPPSDDVGSY